MAGHWNRLLKQLFRPPHSGVSAFWSIDPMRLSLATRIFVGYAVVLATFGAVSLFSITELHRNQLEIRLVSQGYLSLSQTAAAIETFQKNQARDTERLRDEGSVETRRAL